MPGDDDIALSEKRMYGERREETVVWVGSAIGLARVEVSGDRIGRFELAERAPVRDLAAGDGRLVVATPEDVLVGTRSGFEPADFGPATAVGVGESGAPLAAAPDGRIQRLSGDDWVEVGRCGGEVTAIDNTLVGTEKGVYTLDGDLEYAGLDAVRDVAAADSYVATAHGLYERRAGEWAQLLDGEFTVVGSDGDRAHAVRGDLLARRDDDWVAADLRVGDAAVVDVAYGECPYAVTADGQLCVEATAAVSADGAAGWRSRNLGVADVSALAVA